MAVAHADHILELQTNLDGKEMPPEWMWTLPWEMERHMKKVVAARKEKYGKDDDDDDVDMDGDGWTRNEMIPDAWRD